jgi:hypothetical protein
VAGLTVRGLVTFTRSLNAAGSTRRAEVVLVRAAEGAAHVLSRLDFSPAARTRLPAGVQLIAFEVGVGRQQVLVGLLHVVSRLDAR